ncbi:MAG: aldehyde ferredoxin oxidoreductase, partial [Methanobacteriota archaeon]
RVERFRAAIREKVERNGIARGSLHRYGTAALVHVVNEHCILPTRNFQENRFEKAERVSGEEIARTILARQEGCHGCPVACGRVTAVGDMKGSGPEYETIWAFGPACGVDDLGAIARAGHLCNDYGLDTISTGSTIACAMEFSERGYIPDDIRFGDGDRVIELVQQIGRREGIGDQLAEGSYRFAARYGHQEISMSVKGLEMPGYDPRGLLGQGLEYATSVRGACHVYGNMLYPEVLGVPEKLDPSVTDGKAHMVKHMQDLAAVLDSAGICLFSERIFTVGDYAAMLSALTGRGIDASEMLRTGERIWNLQKLFNVAAGFTRRDDNLPQRMSREPLTSGPYAGQVWRRQPMLDEYYRERGWNREGVPTKRKLKSLGLVR